MSEILLDINNLDYSYPLGDKIFEDMSFQMRKGDFTIILGKNGCGKSTLVNLLLGLRTPLKGSINFMGHDPIKDSTKVREEVFFISHSIELYQYSTISYFLKNIAALYPNYSIEKEEQIITALSIDKDKAMCQLSLGQKARVQIVAAIASMTPFILIDEITAVLDPLARETFTNILVNECSEGRSVLMATNIPADANVDMARVSKVSDYKVV